MVSITKLVLVLLLVLPCVLSSAEAKRGTQCPLVSVSASLTSSSSKYNTYEATVRNTGPTSVSNIALSTDATLKSVTDLNESGDSKYTLTNGNSLDAGATYSFTYKVKKQTTVNWSVTCVQVTVAPAKTTVAPTTKAPKATTTKAPKAPTTTKAPKAAATTKAPTKAAPVTTAPTTAPAAPVTGATGSAGGRTCATGSWWRPAPTTTWQWQLTGTIDTTLDVQMYDIDLFDSTAAVISKLQGAGRTVICYFSTQYENWRPDSAQFPASALGNNLDDWAGEKYVDIRSSAIRAIMTARMDLAVSKGCDGLEPDNVDGYEANTGFPLTAADQIDYNTFLANEAHARGLSVGLKNDVDQAATLQPYFDWALNEQCNQYKECDTLTSFITAGKAVFNCEYSGSAASVCPKMVTAKFSTIFKKLALDASVSASCCTYAPGGCAKASYQCISSGSKRSLEVEEVEEEPVQPIDENTAQEAKMSAATTTYASIAVCAGAAVLALLL